MVTNDFYSKNKFFRRIKNLKAQKFKKCFQKKIPDWFRLTTINFFLLLKIFSDYSVKTEKISLVNQMLRVWYKQFL